jgi:hypothetical protein
MTSSPYLLRYGLQSADALLTACVHNEIKEVQRFLLEVVEVRHIDDMADV